MTNHALGIRTCTQSGMTIPSYLPSEMHLQKFPDQTEFQSWIVNFQAGVLRKSEEFRARIAADQVNRSNQLAGFTSSLQNQLREKISLIMKKRI